MKMKIKEAIKGNEKDVLAYANNMPKHNFKFIEELKNDIFQFTRKQPYQIFQDILDLYIATFSFGRAEDLYHTIRKEYDTKEFQFLQILWGKIFQEYYKEIDRGYHIDILGDLYQELSSSSKGKLGQFFSPTCVSQMMALMLFNKEANENEFLLMNEPCSGSGRNVISAWLLNQNTFVNSQDLDNICCKMTIVHMHLYNMLGSEVIHADTIKMEAFGGYRIDADYPIVENMFSNIWESLPNEQKEQLKQLNSKKTTVIKYIPKQEIVGIESIYFSQIRYNVYKYNDSMKLVSKIKELFLETGFPDEINDSASNNDEFENILNSQEKQDIIEQKEKEIKEKFIEVSIKDETRNESEQITFTFLKTKKIEQLNLFEI